MDAEVRGDMWARWTVHRDAAGERGDGIAVDRIGACLGEAQRAPGRLTTIERSYATARKAIGQAASEAAALADDVQVAMASLENEIEAKA